MGILDFLSTLLTASAPVQMQASGGLCLNDWVWGPNDLFGYIVEFDGDMALVRKYGSSNTEWHPVTDLEKL